LHNFGEWLEHFSWVQTISTTAWLYSSISVVHYFTLFILVGTSVLVDLRVLGLAARRQPVVEFAAQVFPWMWTAFGFAVLSGFLMFTTDAGDYLPDTVFEVKMTVILLALIFTIVVQVMIQRRGLEGGQQPSLPGWAKAMAVLSLIFWIGSILAGVEIAAISGLG
jgi:Family of unknown function (DUF6644)